jgi:hypothetical protein
MTETRKATKRLLDMVDDGGLDTMMALQMCLDWLSEAEVAEMLEANDLLEDDEAEDELDDPEDYLFHAYEAESMWSHEDSMVTFVAICPEEYFRKTGYQWDQHIPLGLSEDMSEVQEGLFEYAGTVDEARTELLTMGLREDPAYSAFIQKHNQAEDEDAE